MHKKDASFGKINDSKRNTTWDRQIQRMCECQTIDTLISSDGQQSLINLHITYTMVVGSSTPTHISPSPIENRPHPELLKTSKKNIDHIISPTVCLLPLISEKGRSANSLLIYCKEEHSWSLSGIRWMAYGDLMSLPWSTKVCVLGNIGCVDFDVLRSSSSQKHWITWTTYPNNLGIRWCFHQQGHNGWGILL